MFQIGFLTMDLIILIVIFCATFFIAFKKSKKSVARFVLPFYIATLIYPTLPFKAIDATSKILIFLVTYAVLVFLIKKSITAVGAVGGARHFFDALLLSLSAIFSLFIAYYKILPLDKIIKINFPFSAFILTNIPYYILITIPLVLIYISNAHRD
jgi:hypothetical protein